MKQSKYFFAVLFCTSLSSLWGASAASAEATRIGTLLSSIGPMTAAQASSPAAAPGLEPYLEIEFKHLEETYNLLDTFAQKIWPGWDNYLDIQFRVQFPNLVFMIVNPAGAPPEGYELLPGRTIHGKPIYLNRKEELPIKLVPPLYGGGQGDTNIRIQLQESDLASRLAGKSAAEALEMKKGSASESQILLYIHEYFHTFEQHAWAGWDKHKGERRFAVNTNYAALSEIEGLALSAAYKATKDADALESLKDYMAARELKHKSMTPGAVENEIYTNLEEGLAVYAETRMAGLVMRHGVKSKIAPADDPYFLDYIYLANYVAEKTTGQVDYVIKETLDNGLKYYCFGAIEAYLLDRFVPGWQKGFFETQTDLDAPLRKFLNLSDAQLASLAARLKTRYPYDEIFARHGAVIKERDDALALVAGLKGKKFVLDWKNLKEFFILMPQGKSVRIGVEVIFKEGFEPFTLGEIKLTSEKGLIHETGIWNLEWVDTAPKAGEKGYTLKYATKDGDVYKKAVLTTGGFRLEAPEIKIEETPDQVRIVILSKVTR